MDGPSVNGSVVISLVRNDAVIVQTGGNISGWKKGNHYHQRSKAEAAIHDIQYKAAEPKVT